MNLLLILSLLFPGREGIVIQLKEDLPKKSILLILKELPYDTFYFPMKGIVEDELGFSRVLVVELKEGEKAEDFVNKLKKAKEIAFAEPLMKMELFLNDPLIHYEWGLINGGQPYPGIMRIPGCNNDTLIFKRGLPGACINYIEGLNLMKRRGINDTVIVGIIDTGVDFSHPELEGKIWYNKGEIPGNGLDDDGNGLVDDHRGYDFSGDFPSLIPNGDNDPSDYHGHGTHVAGIVAAGINNLIGISGVAPFVKIMPVKIFPNATNVVAAQGIIYAVKMGAKVINMSWGSYIESELIKMALRYAIKRGVIPVAACGNTGDSGIAFPARLFDVIAVGASTSWDKRADFSSYGQELDFLAPGEDILSLRANGTDMYSIGGCPEPEVHIFDSLYYIADGTSMAAPFVTGVIADILTVSPGLCFKDIYKILQKSAKDLIDPNGNGYFYPGWDIYSGYGRIDLERAIAETPSLISKIESPRQFEHLNEVTVMGTASGDEFKNFALLIGNGFLPDSYDTVLISSTPIEHGVIATFEPPHPGWYTLKLVVNEYSADMVYFFYSNESSASITYPENDDTIRGSVKIKLNVTGNFEYYTLSYKKLNEINYHELFRASTPLFDSSIYTWYTGFLGSGTYILKLDVKSETTLVDSKIVYVESVNLEGWPCPFSGFAGASPKVADLDGDGFEEIILGTTDGVYVFDYDGTLRSGWPTLQGEYARASPAVWDIDQDGFKEIIVATSSETETKLYVLKDDGTIMEGWPKVIPPSLYLMGTGNPLVADIDGDGSYEILYAVSNGIVYAYRWDGSSYLESHDGFFRAATGSVTFSLNPYIFVDDFDGDGENEVIAVWGKANWGESGIWIWKSNGEPYSSNPYGLFYLIDNPQGALMADIDGDGIDDIVVLGDDPLQFHAIKGDSSEIPGWPIRTGLTPSSYTGNSPAMGDIDGDGEPEIVFTIFGYNSAFIYALEKSGEIIYEKEKRYVAGPPVLLYDEGEEGIITRYLDLFIEEGVTFLKNGVDIEPFPLKALSENPIWDNCAPSLSDINHDGMVDIVFPAVSGSLYVWTLDIPFSSSWPMYLHDTRNSGIYEEFPLFVENTVKFDYCIFPNPTEGIIHLGSKVNSPLQIRIYDITGRLLLKKKILKNEISLPLKTGVYFLCIGRKKQKIVIIK